MAIVEANLGHDLLEQLKPVVMGPGFRQDDMGEASRPHDDGAGQPAFLCRAVERCVFRAPLRRPVARRVWDLPEVRPPRPLRLCFSASIRLTTLLGRSSRSGSSIFLPAALRFTSAFSAFSYSSLNF